MNCHYGAYRGVAGGTGLGAVTAVLGSVYRLTDGRHRLRLDRLHSPKPS
jgi:putative ABC transport system permease protein